MEEFRKWREAFEVWKGEMKEWKQKYAC